MRLQTRCIIRKMRQRGRGVWVAALPRPGVGEEGWSLFHHGSFSLILVEVRCLFWFFFRLQMRARGCKDLRPRMCSAMKADSSSYLAFTRSRDALDVPFEIRRITWTTFIWFTSAEPSNLDLKKSRLFLVYATLGACYFQALHKATVDTAGVVWESAKLKILNSALI